MGKLFKKYGTIIVSLFFIVVILIVVLFSGISIKKYRNEVVARDTQIQKLGDTLENIGEVQTGYTMKRAVRTGEEITEDNFEELFDLVSVPVKLGLNAVTDREDLIGNYFKTSLSEGTTVTTDNIANSKVDNTDRYFDVVLDELPIGIKAGDYIDIRITFPFSQDFISIARKKIYELNSGIPKLILNENEIYVYKSMLMDKALYDGTTVYAVSYVDAGSQSTAEVYYPINKNLAELTALNPNILELVKQEMIAKRAQVDSSLGGALDTKSEQDLAKIQSSIQNIRSSMSQSISKAQTDITQRANEASNDGGNSGGQFTN